MYFTSDYKCDKKLIENVCFVYNLYTAVSKKKRNKNVDESPNNITDPLRHI